MRLALRFVADALAIYLALYLVDSVSQGRFEVAGGVWAAVILALLLGFLDCLVRPLHRLRAKPAAALITAALTVLVNALLLQVMAWIGAVSARGFPWVLATAAFVALVTGAINWLIGFGPLTKTRPHRSWKDDLEQERRRRQKQARLKRSE